MVRLDSTTVELGLGGSYRDAVLADTPAAYWPLREIRPSATAATDDSGFGLHGVYNGTPTKGLYGPLPEGGSAVLFDTTARYLTRADDATLKPAAFSVEFWLYSIGASVAERAVIVKANNTWTNGYLFRIAATNFLQFAVNGTANAISTLAAITANTWIHVVGTFTGGVAKLYLNGVLQSTSGALGAASHDASSVYAGFHTFASAATLNGRLAHIAIYGSALSSTRVSAHYAAGSWTDVSADVLGETGVTGDYGISGNTPLDRIAGSGTLTFTLRNDGRNSGAVQGYYSPNHANCRSGFAHGIPVRVRATSTTSRTKFWGTVYDIEPDPGQYRSQRTRCTAHDWMYRLGETDVRSMTAQVSQTDDALMYTILEALPETVQPMAVSINAGLDTFAYALNDFSGGVKAMTAITKVVMSAWAKAFVKGDGTFCYRNRLSQGLLSSALTVSNNMTGLAVPSTHNNIFTRVRVTHHPVTLGATSTEVLFTLPTATSTVPFTAGEIKTIWGPYTDPANRDIPIGGKSFQDPPVSGTDWTANDAADGSGTNRTASYTVTATFFGTAVKFVVTNGGAGTSYLTLLQARGQGIYDRGAVTQESGTGSRPLSIDLPYQDSANIALAIADFVRAEYADIDSQVDEVSILPQTSSTFLAAALDLEPGDLVTVTETVTGLASVETMVHGVHFAIRKGNWFEIRWNTAPKLAGQTWILDSATKSQLDSTTILAYG